MSEESLGMTLPAIINRYKKNEKISDEKVSEEIKNIINDLDEKDNEKTLIFQVLEYKKSNNKNTSEISAELKAVYYDLTKNHKERKIKNGKEMFVQSFVIALILVVTIAIIFALVIQGLFINDGEYVYLLWIIAMICTGVAYYLWDPMWARLAIITTSISTGIFLSSIYSIIYNENLSTAESISVSLAIAAVLITIFQTILTGLIKRRQEV